MKPKLANFAKKINKNLHSSTVVLQMDLAREMEMCEK